MPKGSSKKQSTKTHVKKAPKALNTLSTFCDPDKVASRQENGKFLVYSKANDRRSSKTVKLRELIKMIEKRKEDSDHIIDIDVENNVAIRKSLYDEWTSIKDDAEIMSSKEMLKYLRNQEDGEDNVFSPIINYIVAHQELRSKLEVIINKSDKKTIELNDRDKKYLLKYPPLTGLIMLRESEELPENCVFRLSLKALDKDDHKPKVSDDDGFAFGKITAVDKHDSSITVKQYLNGYVNDGSGDAKSNEHRHLKETMIRLLEKSIVKYFKDDEDGVKKLKKLGSSFEAENLSKDTIKIITKIILSTRIAKKPLKDDSSTVTEKAKNSIGLVFRSLMYSFGLKKVKS